MFQFSLIVILIQEALIGLIEVVAGLSGGVLLATDDSSGGLFLEDLGLPYQGDCRDQHENHSDGGVHRVAALFSFALLRLAGGLGIGPVALGQVLTILLFS